MGRLGLGGGRGVVISWGAWEDVEEEEVVADSARVAVGRVVRRIAVAVRETKMEVVEVLSDGR